MRARKVDGNSKNLLTFAREIGFKVFVRNDPLGDADVQYAGVHEVWEVKDKKGRFTDLQLKMRAAGWVIRTVKTIEDVVLARAEMTRNASAIQRARL